MGTNRTDADVASGEVSSGDQPNSLSVSRTSGSGDEVRDVLLDVLSNDLGGDRLILLALPHGLGIACKTSSVTSSALISTKYSCNLNSPSSWSTFVRSSLRPRIPLRHDGWVRLRHGASRRLSLGARGGCPYTLRDGSWHHGIARSPGSRATTPTA